MMVFRQMRWHLAVFGQYVEGYESLDREWKKVKFQNELYKKSLAPLESKIRYKEHLNDLY